MIQVLALMMWIPALMVQGLAPMMIQPMKIMLSGCLH